MEYIILTGCSKGFGLALHDLLIKQKKERKLIFIGRNLDKLSKSIDAIYIETDFTELNEQKIFSQLPLEKATKITLISNAGAINPICNVKEMDHLELELSYQVNFFAPTKLISILLNWMHGAQLNILNISTGAASHAIAGWAAYCSSKAACKMYLDVLAKEQPHVNVEHIDPGVMDTDMQKTIRNTAIEKMPDVEKFIDFKQSNLLKNPIEVAKDFINKLD